MSADTAYRRPDEVAIVVRRALAGGSRYLVLLRAAHKLGYWHLVAGGVDWGEEPAAAARRELGEETGLSALPAALGAPLSYALADDPEEVRERFPPGTERVTVHPFLADAPAGWEPTLDSEHVEARWLAAADAVALLRYPEPRALVERAARLEDA